MTGKHDITDDALNALFEEARADAPVPSPELLALVTQDAARVQAERDQRNRVIPQRSLISRLLDAIGGWSSLGGLVAAAATGVWIGFSNPTLISPSLGSEIETLESTSVDDTDFGSVFPADTLFFEEG